MDMAISKLGARNMMTLNGRNIGELKDYKIVSSAEGTTELTIKIIVQADMLTLSLSTNSE